MEKTDKDVMLQKFYVEQFFKHSECEYTLTDSEYVEFLESLPPNADEMVILNHYEKFKGVTIKNKPGSEE